MSNKRFWINISLVSLSLVAILGFLLRSKILFPLPVINYDFLLGAHSHFALGGWVTIALLNLLTYTLLPPPFQQRSWYQRMLWGLLITSFGMLFSFFFLGNGVIAELFSTFFIFFTYGYSGCFIKDLLSVNPKGPANYLALGAIICLVISSAGPFTFTYLLASGNKNVLLYKDSNFFYLHFQYNGFFTLAVFALLFHAAYNTVKGNIVPKATKWFTSLLLASVIPSFFLALLWHSNSAIISILAKTGAALIIASLIFFFRMGSSFPLKRVYNSTLARTLCFLVLVSFIIKSILQIGTVIPGLGNAVFGLRPIIIGFLHLVFLGLATFYILSNYIMAGAINVQNYFVRFSLSIFTSAVLLQETILLVQGIGLLLGTAHAVYKWLLWFAAIGLLAGSLLLVLSTIKLRPGK
ncbi:MULTISPECIES: hypothetical protein [Niastella]|uniref:Cytochrome oxidase subunit I profile domain-containing protein n=1 Tax=Niastella soli TaxID=2821487 RepID=A0ABS3Z259_9BACT|nr:hypothetical protein [Niastella soli]MBO9204233.1 hypothetical protein [Niastella soli]